MLRLLVETDGPVKFSHCFEYKTTEIMFVSSVIFVPQKFFIHHMKNYSIQIEDNSKRFLGI